MAIRSGSRDSSGSAKKLAVVGDVFPHYQNVRTLPDRRAPSCERMHRGVGGVNSLHHDTRDRLAPNANLFAGFHIGGMPTRTRRARCRWPAHSIDHWVQNIPAGSWSPVKRSIGHGLTSVLLLKVQESFRVGFAQPFSMNSLAIAARDPSKANTCVRSGNLHKLFLAFRPSTRYNLADT
jgi:hypothetical protein